MSDRSIGTDGDAETLAEDSAGTDSKRTARAALEVGADGALVAVGSAAAPGAGVGESDKNGPRRLAAEGVDLPPSRFISSSSHLEDIVVSCVRGVVLLKWM